MYKENSVDRGRENCSVNIQQREIKNLFAWYRT